MALVFRTTTWGQVRLTVLPPDIEELLIVYLGQFFDNVSTEMGTDPPFPFYLVTRISGGDDMVTDYSTVQIDAFASDRTAASDAARAMHAKMTTLSAKLPLTVGGQTVNVDYVETLETPTWRDYGDNTIQRYAGRYRIDTRLKTT